MSSFIQLIEQPKNVDFCRNPICFVFLAANVWPTAGNIAVGKLEKVGTTTDGQTIVISFLDYDLTFTFKNSVDDSGFQLSTGQTAETTVDQLNYNYYLAKYYNITVDATGKIMFCAKDVCEALGIIWKGRRGTLRGTGKRCGTCGIRGGKLRLVCAFKQRQSRLYRCFSITGRQCPASGQ